MRKLTNKRKTINHSAYPIEFDRRIKNNFNSSIKYRLSKFFGTNRTATNGSNFSEQVE